MRHIRITPTLYEYIEMNGVNELVLFYRGRRRHASYEMNVYISYNSHWIITLVMCCAVCTSGKHIMAIIMMMTNKLWCKCHNQYCMWCSSISYIYIWFMFETQIVLAAGSVQGVNNWTRDFLDLMRLQRFFSHFARLSQSFLTLETVRDFFSDRGRVCVFGCDFGSRSG